MEKNKYEDVIENQIKESSKIIALCVDQNHEGKGGTGKRINIG